MNREDTIKDWMEKFKSAWLAKDVDAVFNLLSDDVEYWETPFKKMGKDIELRNTWEEIIPLENMDFEYEIFSTDLERNRFGVKWKFTYKTGESAGAYLIELDKDGLCNYFYHSAQSRE